MPMKYTKCVENTVYSSNGTYTNQNAWVQYTFTKLCMHNLHANHNAHSSRLTPCAYTYAPDMYAHICYGPFICMQTISPVFLRFDS